MNTMLTGRYYEQKIYNILTVIGVNGYGLLKVGFEK